MTYLKTLSLQYVFERTLRFQFLKGFSNVASENILKRCFLKKTMKYPMLLKDSDSFFNDFKSGIEGV